MTPEAVSKSYDRLKKEDSVLYKKGNRTMKELHEIQDILMIALAW